MMSFTDEPRIGRPQLLAVQPEAGDEVPAGRLLRSVRDTLGRPPP